MPDRRFVQGCSTPGVSSDSLRSPSVRTWFHREFPDGPTPAQAVAWPTIASGENVLLVSPTGTGKTLAAFLSILDRLHQNDEPASGLLCVYVSPLRSLGYDIERNLTAPLDAIRAMMGRETPLATVGVRTGDTTPRMRRALREHPPHILITTPESLSLMMAQPSWHGVWKTVEHIVIDEIHALAATKRGTDLMATVERLSAKCDRDPSRIGLSATCRPADVVAKFLVGPTRTCRVLDAPLPQGEDAPEVRIESLIRRDEAPHRALTYRRLLKSLRGHIEGHRTTIVFANTRALTEKVTHDLRKAMPSDVETVAAHHSALDSGRRREVEASLKGGQLRAVVTSTSLELGVDIGTADLTAMVGLPGSVSRCLQRVGRSGHRLGAKTKGVILCATAAEIAGAVVTANASHEGRVEPLRPIASPLDVLCQQLIGMACGDEWDSDEAFTLLRKTASFEGLDRADFDSCLDSIAGDLPSPPGAFEPEPGAEPRFTSPRIWKNKGRFAVRNRRVIRWFLGNVGTISSEESVRVICDDREIGSVEAAYAERLQPGDRFVLDGRSLEFRKLDGLVAKAVPTGGEPDLPRWSSDRQSLSPELARDLAIFREEASRLMADGPSALRATLVEGYGLDPEASAVIEDLIAAQDQISEIPPPGGLLVEQSPCEDGESLAFHLPLARTACEAIGRAVSARLGRKLGRDISLTVSDLGFVVRLPLESPIVPDDIASLLSRDLFESDVLEGIDRGELSARRFRHIAATALMVLRRPDGGRTRVGGMLWVSNRLFPLVKAACPDHPLLRETRREVLNDLLDTSSALAWIDSKPTIRFRTLDGPSPFTLAWLDPGASEAVRFETPGDALKRLHARLIGSGNGT